MTRTITITILLAFFVALTSTAQDTYSTAVDLGTLTCAGSPYTNIASGNTSTASGSECYNGSNDHFYSFTISSTSDVTIDLCNSGYDTYLRLLTSGAAGCSAATQLFTDDDGSCSTRSRISQTLAAGTYIIVVEGYSSSNGAYQVDMTLANCVALTPMSYSSSTVSQASTDNVGQGTSNEKLITVEVVTNGNSGAFDLTQLQINLNGTTSLTDITNINVYYTGTSATFGTGIQFGTTTAPSAGTISINGSQTLTEGSNYFWIAADVSGSATVGNFLDAECTQITMNGGIGNQTPSGNPPAGNREIVLLPSTYFKRIGSAGGSSWGRGIIYESTDNTHMIIGSISESGVTAGNNDFLLAKVDSVGDTVWTKCYGTSNNDTPYDIVKCSDGNYIIVGQSNFDYAVILKVSATGTLMWRQFIEEGSTNSAGYAVVQISDGTIVVVGKGDFTDMYLWRLNYSTGALINSKELWRSAVTGEAYDVLQTSDGGAIVVGKTNNDFTVVKITSSLTTDWRMDWGGGNTDQLETIIENGPGDYTVFGSTYSLGPNTQNAYAMRFINTTGTPSVIWEKTYDAGGNEDCTEAIETTDGGYIMVGKGTIVNNTAENDGMVTKINSSGDVVWSKYIGSDDFEPYAIAPAGDDFVATGLVNPNAFLQYFKIADNGYNCLMQMDASTTVTNHSSSITTSNSWGINNGFGTTTSAPAITVSGGFPLEIGCENISAAPVPLSVNNFPVLRLHCNNSRSILEWNTESFRNESSSYIVEGSTNGYHFYPVENQSISSSNHKLTCELRNNGSSQHYPYLRVSSGIYHSNVVQNKCGQNLHVTVAPTLFSNTLHLSFSESLTEEVHYTLLNVLGASVCSGSVPSGQWKHDFTTPENCASGTYILNIQGKTFHKNLKVIKQ